MSFSQRIEVHQYSMRGLHIYTQKVVYGCNESGRERLCLPVTTKETWTSPSAGAVRAMGKDTLCLPTPSSTLWSWRTSPKNPIVPYGIPLWATVTVTDCLSGSISTSFEADRRSTVNVFSSSSPWLARMSSMIGPTLYTHTHTRDLLGSSNVSHHLKKN